VGRRVREGKEQGTEKAKVPSGKMETFSEITFRY